MSIKETEILKSFGTKVRRIRKENGLSMQSLANIAEIELSQIYRIETGKINPTLVTLNKLSIALGIELGELVGIGWK